MSMELLVDASAPATEAGNCELPFTYAYSFLTLLPRDPHRVFAQWEATDDDIARARASAAASAADKACGVVLRLYDLTDAAARPADFAVAARQRMYVRVAVPGRRIVARLGVGGPGGTFVPVVTSNVVVLPPGRPADEGELFRAGAFDPAVMFRADPDVGRLWGPDGGPGSSDFAVRPKTDFREEAPS